MRTVTTTMAPITNGSALPSPFSSEFEGVLDDERVAAGGCGQAAGEQERHRDLRASAARPSRSRKRRSVPYARLSEPERRADPQRFQDFRQSLAARLLPRRVCCAYLSGCRGEATHQQPVAARDIAAQADAAQPRQARGLGLAASGSSRRCMWTMK